MRGGKMNRTIIMIMLIAILLVAGCSKATGNAVSDKVKVTVFKSATCGCCSGYVEELKNNGYDVDVQITSDVDSIKDKYNVPASIRSCHTSVIGDYFVEGHVSMKAIEKLLREKPEINGIGTPGMPAGSPGMPGVQTEDFVVYAVSGDEVSEFVIV